MHRLGKIVKHLPLNKNEEKQSACTGNKTQRIIHLGPIPKEVGSEVGLLSDLNRVRNASNVRQQFWSVGYGLFRSLVDRELVLNAQETILTKLQNKHHIFAERESGTLQSHITQQDIPCLEGMNDVTHSDAVLSVLENESIQNVMKILLHCERVKTFDFKWLRLICPGSNTGVHVDSVYMNRGTDRLLTCWIPLMDISMELGTVFVLDGSHYLPSFNIFQQTYGSMDAEAINLNGTGHFTQNPDEMKKFFKNEKDYKIRWKSCDFKAGDVLIFTMRTVHMSSVNMSANHQVRISCDTRWLNANEIADARYVYNEHTKTMGHAPQVKFGLYNTDNHGASTKDQVTIHQLRQKWRI